MSRVTLQTGPGVFEVLANVCRSHQEAVKQFVENSADAIQQATTDERRISIHLQYASDGDEKASSLKNIVITDNGIGMSREKMKYILGHIGNSEKVQMALKGEKGIGILAFSMVAEELHIASTDTDGTPSNCLVLKRPWLKTGRAEVIEHCPRHKHSRRGTTAYLENILPEVADKLTKERLKEYLGREFANDLMQGSYAMSISDGGEFEPVPPKRATTCPDWQAKDTSCRTALSSSYWKPTSWKAMSPRTQCWPGAASGAARMDPTVRGSRSSRMILATRPKETNPVDICTIRRPRLRMGQMSHTTNPA